MKRRTILHGMGASAFLAIVAGAEASAQKTPTSAGSVVFELRTYHANPGKLDDLLARFRDHTIELFKKHGLESIAYWVPTEEPLKDKTLIYMLRHPSREAATANWAAFHDDPEWKRVSAATEANGKLTEKVDSTFLKLTDFSPRI